MSGTEKPVKSEKVVTMGGLKSPLKSAKVKAKDGPVKSEKVIVMKGSESPVKCGKVKRIKRSENLGSESKSDITCTEIVNELQVFEENVCFQWKLEGFAEIPFITGFPVYSPPFCLGRGSESVWQLLLLKELQSLKIVKIKDGKKSEKTKDVAKETSDPEATKDTEDFKKSKEGKKSGKTKDVAKETSDPEATKDTEDFKKSKEGKKSGKTKDVAKETMDPKSKEDTSGDTAMNVKTSEIQKKAVGFTIIKTEESSTWEVINYHINVRLGGVCKTIKYRMGPGYSFSKDTKFEFLYEEDLGVDFKDVDTVCIEAFIEHKFLELYPLEPAGELEDGQIAQDLYTILKKPKPMFSDILLKAGDLEIPANKCILCARSYGFDCRLQERKEVQKTLLKLDVDTVVLRAMLAYIYCGGIPVEFPISKCVDLFLAAVKYRVAGLRLAVMQFLIKRKALKPDNESANLARSQYNTIIYLQDMNELEGNLISENRYCNRN